MYNNNTKSNFIDKMFIISLIKLCKYLPDQTIIF